MNRPSVAVLYAAAVRTYLMLAEYGLSNGAAEAYLAGLVTLDADGAAFWLPPLDDEAERYMVELAAAGLIEMLPADPAEPWLRRYHYVNGADRAAATEGER